MRRSHRRSVIALMALLTIIPFAGSLPAAPVAAATQFADPAFQNQWQQGEALTPNFYGPLMTAHEGQQEAYKEAPGGMRLVQYFDKARMELNSANGTVTSGLLATELVTGRLQAGDNTFDTRQPAGVPVAGDPDNVGPTYAQIGASGLTNAAASAVDQPTTRSLTSGGAVGTFAAGSGDTGAVIGGYDTATQHNVPRAFVDYRAAAGLLTIGFAIAEPFWANGVRVAGQPKDVLVQAFERRVLTYTPANPDAFKVEFGNIGAHYITWRYATGGGTTTGTGNVPIVMPMTTMATSTPVLMAAPTNTPVPMAMATSTPTRAPVAMMPTATATPMAGAPMAVAKGTGTVFLIMMENHGDASILGNADAPFLNQLAAQNTVADQYFAIRHPSLPNYLALFGGHTYGIDDDCDNRTKDCIQDAPNLADALEAKGKTWKSYQEDLPQPCFLGDSAGGAGHYAIRHNPFAYFKSIRENQARCNRIVPFTQLDADLASGQMPDFAWITPNLTHDMHDSDIRTGDQFLASFVPKILQSDAWKNGGQLVITWDEDENGDHSEHCCNGVATGGRIPLLIVTPGGPMGNHLTTPLTHYSLLRAIEDRWGLDPVGHSADADVPRLPAPGLGKVP